MKGLGEFRFGVGVDSHQPVGTEIGRPSSARTRRRVALAISASGPKRWDQPATSAKASLMEIRSTRSVKSSTG
jgi:hypothetical protein